MSSKFETTEPSAENESRKNEHPRTHVRRLLRSLIPHLSISKNGVNLISEILCDLLSQLVNSAENLVDCRASTVVTTTELFTAIKTLYPLEIFGLPAVQDLARRLDVSETDWVYTFHGKRSRCAAKSENLHSDYEDDDGATKIAQKLVQELRKMVKVESCKENKAAGKRPMNDDDEDDGDYDRDVHRYYGQGLGYLLNTPRI